MDFSTLDNTLISALSLYGAPILALVVLVGTIGLPVPSTTLLVAGGALVQQQGANPAPLIVAALGAAILGDSMGYLVGRYGADRVSQRSSGNALWQRASDAFHMQGGLAIYLSRWLLTAVAVPTNLVAGASRYSARRFLVAEIGGDVTWVLLYGGVGYLVGAQWQSASANLQGYALSLGGAVLLVIAVWQASRHLLLQRRSRFA